MQRGRIIQYNPNDGTGIVLVGQEQRRFGIGEWRGDEAPQLNRVAEVEEDGGLVTRITPVSERVLLAEKANDRLMLSDARFMLARSIASTDPKRARTLAGQARVAYVAAGSQRAPHLEQLNAFLETLPK